MPLIDAVKKTATREILSDLCGWAAIWYGFFGLLCFIPGMRQDVCGIPWWLVYVLSPFILTAMVAAMGALLLLGFLLVSSIYFPFRDLWNGFFSRSEKIISEAGEKISSPLEALARKADAARCNGERGKSVFYEKSSELLKIVFAIFAMFIIGTVLNFLGCHLDKH